MKKNWKQLGTALFASIFAASVLAGCAASGQSGASSAAQTSASEDTSAAKEEAESSKSESSEEAASGENSSDELAAVQSAGKLVIGIEGTYPPFTYHDKDGNLVGLDVEVGKKIAEKLGVQAEFVEAPWDSLLIGMDSGRFDTVINCVSITPEREEKYDFSEPYYYEARRVVVRADDDRIKSDADLAGMKVATNTTNAFIPWYEEKGAEIMGIDTSGEAIELVLSGRADFCGASVPVLNAYLEEHPDAEKLLKVAFVIPNSEDVIAIPVRKGEPRFLDAINQALTELREEGTLKEISEKYLKGDYTSSAYSK